MNEAITKPLRIGLIGVGLIGRRHLQVLQDNPVYEVVGIVDPSDAAKELCDQRSITRYQSTEALLDQAPEGVVAAIPNQLHLPIGKIHLERGIPVLMEKPLADTVEDAAVLARLSAMYETPMLVAHHRRHYRFMVKAKEVIDGGAIGNLLAVNGSWLGDKPRPYFEFEWRRQPGGGPVLINAIHDIDNLRMLCGEIDSVQAMTANTARGFPVEDTATVLLRFENGALGTLILSDAAPSNIRWECGVFENPDVAQGGKDCYSISGTKGTLFIPSMTMQLRNDGEHWHHAPVDVCLEREDNDAYVAQMQHFSDVIRGKTEPIVSAQDGLRTLVATQAILKAADSGQTVRIADELAKIGAEN